MSEFQIPKEWTGPVKCRSCPAFIYWKRTEAGKPMPMNRDGTPHFATCPQGKDWKGKTRKDPNAPPPAQGELLEKA